MTKQEKITRLKREEQKLWAVKRAGFTDRPYATASEQAKCVSELLGDIWRQLRRLGCD